MSKKANYSYVGVGFIILVFGIIFVPKIIDRLKYNNTVENDRLNIKTEEERATKSDLAYLEINGSPKKVPEFNFVNQDGDTISNQDYLGKVYVVEFFFTTCPTICPRMNRNLVEIQNEFTQFDNFGVASFTITPEIDTPEVLKAYAIKYGITNPNWNLMTGEEDKIYELANVGFNIYVGKDDSVEAGFEHSGNFALIDKEGYIRSRKDDFGNPKIFYSGIISEAEKVDDEGMKEEISMLKEDIAKLLKE
ncbi:SCO family protein [Hanstruepera ponticola]|uniref:SCO family protein n=1 Tax=Hanstruepera ponticola TaxID=2042995 RepID=UPI001780A95D|nr:SCO family protein [Hanstruepera ponticola]